MQRESAGQPWGTPDAARSPPFLSSSLAGIISPAVMTTPAKSARDLLRRLRSSWTERWPSFSKEDAVQIDSIGETHDSAAVPALLGLLFGQQAAAAKAAAKAINEIVTHIDSVELAQMDGKVREVAEWRASPISPADISRLSHGLTGTLGVISFNGSGFVREAAVRELAHIGDGSELPFLLIRLNDWVKPVRKAAKKAVISRIRLDYAPHFLHCLPLVDHLRVQRREDHQHVLGSVFSLLRSPECRAQLRCALSAKDRPARRLSFELLMAAGDEELLSILEQAVESNEGVIRLKAARKLREILDGPPLAALLKRLGQDRFMPVRREALYGYVEKLPDLAESNLRIAALDGSAAIRETGRFYLQKLRDVDFVQLYGAQLHQCDEKKLIAAIAGIGETGTAKDATLLRAFLEDANHRIRRAAVRAIGRLDAEPHSGQLLAALQDSFASVAKAARDVILANPPIVTTPQLWSVFRSTNFAHSRRFALALIAQRRWWDCGPLLILAAGSEDEGISAIAVESLSRWRGNLHRLSVRPSREELKTLEDAVRHKPPVIDESTWDDLQFLLSYAKRELTGE